MHRKPVQSFYSILSSILKKLSYSNCCACWITRPVCTCVHMFYCMGASASGHGPSCPVDFPLNISLFIHSFVVARQVPKSINWIYMRIKRRKWLTNATWHVLACVSVFSGEKDSRVELSLADAKTFYERIARRLDAHLPSVCSAGVDRCASEHYWLDANLPTWTIGVVAATPRWAHHTHEILFRRLYRTIQTCVVWLPTVVKIII